MLAHLATFAGTPCHFASDDGARLNDLSRLRRLPPEFDRRVGTIGEKNLAL